MPRNNAPIADDELSGLIMAVTAEAGRAGWTVRYGIQGDGSLVFHIGHAQKKFSIVTADQGKFKQLQIVTADVTAEMPEPIAYHWKTEPDVTAGKES